MKADSASGANETAAWWDVLEAAWKEAAPELRAIRKRMAANKATDDDYGSVEEALEKVVEELEITFDELDEPKLLQVDRALERALYRIDRADIQAVTDGSGDGFLHRRGFIVAIGKDYADAVDRDPAVARVGREAEEICYLPREAYKRRFGEMPATESGVSRESCSNAAGWPARTAAQS